MRILLSEGQSTSARQAVTALGLAGHRLEVADPDRFCFCRFSRFVDAVHRVPGIARDPVGYLEAIAALLAGRRFDVLLPIHEQAYVLAKAAQRLSPLAGLALPAFAAFDTAIRKSAFSRLLADLGIPQPATRILPSLADLGAPAFPFVLKTDIGTASRGVWIIAGADDLARAVAEAGDDPGPFLVQEFLGGDVEHAQAVFARGRLLAVHGYRRVVEGVGGGAAVKVSIERAEVRRHLALIGERLHWHGGLSVDYILRDGVPNYIDCNPRLVEPMSAALAGVDLAGLLLAVSLGEEPEEQAAGRAGVRTRLAMQGLLGAAWRTGSRLAVAREICLLLRRSGPYAGTAEELTPLTLDAWSAVPLLATAALTLARPAFARALPRRGWGAQLLTPRTIAIVNERL
jgi:predicted ATP-grasp superfamily ATP-dependent carboligase